VNVLRLIWCQRRKGLIGGFETVCLGVFWGDIFAGTSTREGTAARKGMAYRPDYDYVIYNSQSTTWVSLPDLRGMEGTFDADAEVRIVSFGLHQSKFA
jgi:hypothetical protein